MPPTDEVAGRVMKTIRRVPRFRHGIGHELPSRGVAPPGPVRPAVRPLDLARGAEDEGALRLMVPKKEGAAKAMAEFIESARTRADEERSTTS